MRKKLISKPVFIVLLGAVSLGLALALSQGGHNVSAWLGWRDRVEETPHSVSFDTVLAKGPGSFFRMKDAADLEPQSGKSFILSLWFSIHSLPEDSQEREVLVAKFEGNSKARPGYAVGVRKDGNSLRPSVYWRDSRRHGGWFEFPPIDYEKDAWYLLVMSFREEKFLGLHFKTVTTEKNTKLGSLGGYDVSEVKSVENDSTLVVGAPARTELRLALGPLSIVTTPREAENFQKVLSTLENADLSLLSALEGVDPVLWVEGSAADKSSRNHKIKSVRIRPHHRAELSSKSYVESRFLVPPLEG